MELNDLRIILLVGDVFDVLMLALCIVFVAELTWADPECVSSYPVCLERLWQFMVSQLTQRTACVVALVVLGIRFTRWVNMRLRRNLLDLYAADKRVLWSQLPDVVWRQVFQFREVLECSSEASGFFGLLELRTGYLVLRRGKALPPVSREWNVGGDPESGPTPLLSSLVGLKIPITTFQLHLHRDFRPDGEMLYSFLAFQTDTLVTLHISCRESSYVRAPLQLKLPTMRQVRNLEILRSVTCVRKSVVLLQPIQMLFPELESVRLSLWGWEDWSDLLPSSLGCDNVTKVSFVADASPRRVRTLCRVTDLFPNVDCLEIPCLVDLADDFRDWIWESCLRRLTLTLPRGLNRLFLQDFDFDVFLTGYGSDACAAILKNPDRDPDEVHREIEAASERKWYLCWGQPEGFGIEEGWAEERAEIIQEAFLDLEEIRIKCEDDTCGPTAVCVPDLLRMHSLRTLDFGGCSKRIPEHLMRQLRDRFTVKL